jgi:hypothetical protein
MLALEVGKAESYLPGLPCARCGWEAFLIVDLTREVLGCQDSCQRHHDKFDVSDRHASPFSLFLGILYHDNELGDAIHLHIVLHHVHAKQDHVEGMKPIAVGIEEGHDVDGHDLHVEGVGIFWGRCTKSHQRHCKETWTCLVWPPCNWRSHQVGICEQPPHKCKQLLWPHQQSSCHRVGDKPGVRIWHHGWLHT